MSKNEDLAIRSITKRIREEGFDAIQDLMNLAISGHLQDRLPEGEPYTCPTCKQNAPILFRAMERAELKGRYRWKLAASRHSADPKPEKIDFTFHVIGRCENCGVITTFDPYDEIGPVLAGMMYLISMALDRMDADEGGDDE